MKSTNKQKRKKTDVKQRSLMKTVKNSIRHIRANKTQGKRTAYKRSVTPTAISNASYAYNSRPTDGARTPSFVTSKRKEADVPSFPGTQPHHNTISNKPAAATTKSKSKKKAKPKPKPTSPAKTLLPINVPSLYINKGPNAQQQMNFNHLLYNPRSIALNKAIIAISIDIEAVYNEEYDNNYNRKVLGPIQAVQFPITIDCHCDEHEAQTQPKPIPKWQQGRHQKSASISGSPLVDTTADAPTRSRGGTTVRHHTPSQSSPRLDLSINFSKRRQDHYDKTASKVQQKKKIKLKFEDQYDKSNQITPDELEILARKLVREMEEEEEEEQTPEVEEEEELIMVDEEAILARLKTPTITKDTKHKTKKRKNKRKKPRKTNDANFLAINDETENNGSDGSGYEETAAALSSIRSKIANSDGRLITKHESQHSMTAIMDLVKKTKSNMALDLEILADKSSSEDPREDEEEELYMSALLTPSPDDSFSDHVQLIENMLKQPIVGAVPPKMHRKKSGKKTKRKKKNKNKHKKAKRAERAEIDIMKALQEDIKIQNTKDDITKAYMTTPEPDSNDSLNVDESHDSSSEEPPSFWNNSSMHDDQAMLQRMITNENQMLDAIMSPKLGFDDHLTKAELSSDWDDDELNNVKLVRKPKKKPVPKHKRGKKSTVPKGMDKKSRKKKHKRNKTMQ
eukprot:575324_1